MVNESSPNQRPERNPKAGPDLNPASSPASSPAPSPAPCPAPSPASIPASNPAPRPESAPESGSATGPSNGSSSSVSTSAPPRPLPVRPVPKQLPPWQVLLHNDDVNEVDYVVNVLERIARLQRPAATRCMVEAHRRGLSLVTTTHRERAELLAEQFRSCRLTVTIEPVR